MISRISDTFKRLPEIIGHLDAEAVLDLFENRCISVNVPRYGQIGNNIVFGRYLKQVRLWLGEREGVRFEYWGAVHSAECRRLALNMVYYFSIDDEEFDYHKELHIPISVMCELNGEDKIRTARVYYNTSWIAGHNITRPALLNEDPSIIPSLPEKMRIYFESLWKGDARTILDHVLDKDAYFMGTLCSYNQGPDLIKTFDGLFEGGKNTELRLCSMFIADNCLVVEYSNHRSGGNPNTPSSGMAIYKYNDAGKMCAVRLAGDSAFDHCLWPTL